MTLAVDNPIVNSPFEEPTRYWDYKEGQPVLAEGRRPAGYYLRPRTRGPQVSMFEEEFVPLDMVNVIRERLQVLLPWHARNYYQHFDLVPSGMLEVLQQGKYQITNWHLFQPQDDSRSRSVVQRGPESDRALCNRVLKELGNKQNILVINDEAHHAYRPAQPLTPEELNQLRKEEREALEEEFREATVWISGLVCPQRPSGLHDPLRMAGGSTRVSSGLPGSLARRPGRAGSQAREGRHQ